MCVGVGFVHEFMCTWVYYMCVRVSAAHIYGHMSQLPL